MIPFYFDYLSPYSYLAWKKMEHNPNIELRPILLDKIFRHWDVKGPAETPPKRDFLFKQCLRKAQSLGIPLVTPPDLPFPSLYALRLSTKAVGGEQQREIIGKLWEAAWGKGQNIGDLNILESIVGEEILGKASSKEARNEIKANIKLALKDGVFGVPCFVLQGELFWGLDSIEDLIEAEKGVSGYNETFYKDFIARFENETLSGTHQAP